ncbi:hypothetical protein H0H81_008984 [Sphagnurus paluster]|uniref:Uncharacterized protein n=1 Tax=Sphagnurus paluster TaxID=117069 RepID=A0A9P7FTV2_9AGAR|nr:hypothetical protein H0H81_008984 [Sphagnurus paluster]
MDPSTDSDSTQIAAASRRATIDSEVRRLMARSNKVDETFQRIREGLGEIDQHKLYIDGEALVAEPLQPEWIRYQERFVELCLLSSERANRAHINANGALRDYLDSMAYPEHFLEFAKVILPCLLSQTTSIAKKHEALTVFFDKIKPEDRLDDEEISQTKELILSLKSDVQSFLTRFSKCVGDPMAEDMKFLYAEMEA